MRRFLLASVIACGLAGGAVPVVAGPPDVDDVVTPCGDDYGDGVYIYVPGRERPIPLCIVQH